MDDRGENRAGGESFRVRTDDGFEVAARRFEPGGAAAGTAIVFGATGARQRYYRRFACWLAERGLRAVTFDFRGVGASRPEGGLRGFEADMTDWAHLDAAAVVRHVEASWPGAPWVAVGHSFGGQLVGLLDEMRRAEGLLMVAAQSGWEGNWRGLGRLKVTAFWHLLIPLLTPLVGYFPAWSGFGEDLPAGVVREWRAWAVEPGYYTAEGHHPEARDRLARFDRPIVSYSFSDDSIAPRAAVEQLHGWLTGAAVDHRHLRPADVGRRKVGHFGFFRPDLEEPLWHAAHRFLVARIGAAL